MSVARTIRRAAVVGGGVLAAVSMGVTSASAHHCYVPMYSLNGPQSANWAVFTAEDGATMFADYVEPCAGATDAAYAALRDAGMPVGIKLFEKMVIGEGSSNPNRDDGKGLEDFVEGSTLADEMIGAFIGAAWESCAS